MILAAGLGTRLLPLTRNRPKPLFTLGNRPILDILITRLRDAGFDGILVNTHHLHEMIHDYVASRDYDIPVWLRHEPQILGTGGAIKNVEDLWDDRPLLVVNGDVFTDIDFRRVYDSHSAHDHWVTMVLHHRQPFNNVRVDRENRVVGFLRNDTASPDARLLAFTGIHVLSRAVLDFIPEDTFTSIIDTYERLIEQGHTIRGLVVSDHYWHDIGTPSGYRQAATEAVARSTLAKLASRETQKPLVWTDLKGDGSDRIWQRVSAGGRSIVLVNHGISPEGQICEADAFWSIGRHLEAKGIPVPHLYGFHRPSGVIAMADLGDLHLQELVSAQKTASPLSIYRPVIDLLVDLGIKGREDFDTAWTYQTPYYDRQVIREKECDYFLREFVNGLMGRNVDPESLQTDFSYLADRGLSATYQGLLHRDFQSRNILVYRDNAYVIDYQGARLGPLAYDLAALLIDPYVGLDADVQDRLLAYYIERLGSYMSVDPGAFRHTYRYCAVNRNLQILGAFGFLTRVKGKRWFHAYVPAAVNSLKYHLSRIDPEACTTLKAIVQDF